jgi:hypothetical protein
MAGDLLRDASAVLFVFLYSFLQFWPDIPESDEADLGIRCGLQFRRHAVEEGVFLFGFKVGQGEILAALLDLYNFQ